MTAFSVPNPFTLTLLEETGSTNDDAKQLGQENAPNFSVVIAKRMTKGRGRFNRKWEAPEGNLFWSCLLYPPQGETKPVSDLSFIAALAVFNLMKSYNLKQKIAIKWPNDIVIQTDIEKDSWAKMSGILIESFSKFAVVGIGINLKHSPDLPESDFNHLGITNLKDLGIDLDITTVLYDLCTHFYDLYTEWQEHGLKRLITTYNAYSWRLGETLTVSLNADKTNLIKGINRGILSSGTLCIENNKHQVVEISAGDVLNLPS